MDAYKSIQYSVIFFICFSLDGKLIAEPRELIEIVKGDSNHAIQKIILALTMQVFIHASRY